MSAAATALKKPKQTLLAKAAERVKKFVVRRAGFLKIEYKVEFYELMRLTSGKAEIGCLLLILSETKGAARGESEVAPPFSRRIPVEEFARFVGGIHQDAADAKKAGGAVANRTIQVALKGLKDRGMITEPEPECYHACTDRWPKLDAYQPGPELVEPAEDTEEEEPEPEEPAKKDEDRVPVFSQPIRVRPGRASRPKKLPVPAEYVEFDVDSEGVVDGYIRCGVLRIFVRNANTNEENANRSSGLSRNLFRDEKDTPVDSNSVNSNGALKKPVVFAPFLELALEARFRTTEELIKKAEKLYLGLPTVIQLTACRGLKAQIDAGDYPNDAYPTRIDRYVEDKMWQATPRAKPMSSAELRQAAGDRKKESALAHARRLDRDGF